MSIVISDGQIQLNNFHSYGNIDHLGNAVAVTGCAQNTVIVPVAVPSAFLAALGASDP